MRKRNETTQTSDKERKNKQRKSIDDCTPAEWDEASRATGWGGYPRTTKSKDKTGK